MIGHSRDHVRLILKVHALLFHSGVRGLKVGHGKIQDRTGMIELRPLWTRQHQTHPSAVEKGEPRPGLEQQLQSQHILIEIGGPLYIVRIDGNLSDARDSDSRRSYIHVLTSPSRLFSLANNIGLVSSSKKCRRAGRSSADRKST